MPHPIANHRVHVQDTGVGSITNVLVKGGGAVEADIYTRLRDAPTVDGGGGGVVGSYSVGTKGPRGERSSSCP